MITVCQRRMRRNRDRISALPDEVIHHILSFMTVGEAVPTSVLSKKWRYRWTLMTKLHFLPYCDASQVFQIYSRQYPSSCYKYVSKKKYGNCNMGVISGCLKQYQAKQLQKICVEIYETKDDASECVLEWLKFAVDRKVEDVNVVAPVGLNPSTWYKVPDSLFSSRHLRVLSLGYCNLYPLIHINCCFDSLVSLSLKQFQDYDGALQSLVSRCHNLRFLYFMNYIGRERLQLPKLSLSLPRVQTLHIVSASAYPLIEIFAPNLQNLRVHGPFFCNLRVWNSPQLQKAYFFFRNFSLTESRQSPLDVSPSKHPHFWGFNLQSMANIKSLHLMHDVFKVMYTDDYASGAKKFALNNLKELVLDNMQLDATVYPVVNFLRGCPYLEKFCVVYGVVQSEPNLLVKIKKLAIEPDDDDRKLHCDFHGYFFQHLKRVRLRGIQGDAKQMILLKFLLGKAASLDNVRVEYNVKIQDHIDYLFEYLSSLSKISPHATVESFGRENWGKFELDWSHNE